MISTEKGVMKGSEYFIHTVSPQAAKTFFYPTYVGYFYYKEGYRLSRNSYNSFLIIYIKKGICYVQIEDKEFKVCENQIVILDCYKPHTYYTKSGFEAEWIHFDGAVAREYFEMIIQNSGNVLSLMQNYNFEKYLHRIYLSFKDNKPIKDALLSHYISAILTELMISKEISIKQSNLTDKIGEITAYIGEHFSEELSLEKLADKACISQYYFTRLFKKETGFTPYEFLLITRINAAKFLLNHTNSSIKKICFSTGFLSESNFCTAFKRIVGMTPSNYRFISVNQGQLPLD